MKKYSIVLTSNPSMPTVVTGDSYEIGEDFVVVKRNGEEVFVFPRYALVSILIGEVKAAEETSSKNSLKAEAKAATTPNDIKNIYVNGELVQVESVNFMSYSDLARLAGLRPEDAPTITMISSRGPRIVLPLVTVVIEDGMRFNIVITGDA